MKSLEEVLLPYVGKVDDENLRKNVSNSIYEYLETLLNKSFETSCDLKKE